jgi:hypothetical protein
MSPHLLQSLSLFFFFFVILGINLGQVALLAEHVLYHLSHILRPTPRQLYISYSLYFSF